jgi:outer membrane protein assembly factor BamD
VKLKTFHAFLPFAALLLVAAISSCGSGSDQLTKTAALAPTDTLFAEGKRAYDKEDWLEAMRIFEEVRVQAPSSELAPQSTYFEAMARFRQEMFSSAAVDFRAVRRNYPGTPLASRAQYMVGESYFQLAPRPELDQSYTILALGEYQAFLRDYPTAAVPLLDSAKSRILEIRSKLAQKYFLAALLYDKLEDSKSALVYYGRVLDQYYDMPQAAESEVRIAEINFDRKKLDETRKALDAFDLKYLQTATPDERDRALKLHSRLPSP